MKKELDCRGLQCPEPVIRCRALLAEKDLNALTVTVDNIAALENVSRFLDRNGFGVSSQKTGENEWLIKASRSGALPEFHSRKEPAGIKTLVLLTSETFGNGDPELGLKLMNTFLGNVSELEGLWRVILLNSAVKLSAREGEALEHLEKLESAGTSVLVCGTCLMHYGLLEKKKVGETTNMMDVISSLSLASKVIRP